MKNKGSDSKKKTSDWEEKDSFKMNDKYIHKKIYNSTERSIP